MGYYQTLIAVADDCPVTNGEIPPVRGGKATIASLQYEMLRENPGVLTQEDILFNTWLMRQEDTEISDAKMAQLREQFFAKPQACLRASPLPKRYGWGLLFDDEGRVTLCAMDSDQYRAILAGEIDDIKVVKAVRSKRA